ncbi:hypothetical protein [Mycolicibacterium stellerae]|uniref:hypothetical protein n=1 Tax=Mycolicibacterium stellerae TaxID=2358193 RepID=UPI000F0BD8EE|nr:hypothetical protein [Mycolicibacterium stellerae]
MTETTMRAPRLLRAVFVAHGLITLAGAVVLTVTPTAIPAAVGITLERQEYLLVYLVGAAELAVAVLSFGATRLTDEAALRLVVTTFVVLHGASGVLDLVYMAAAGPNATVIANTVLRFTVVAVFLFVWRAARPHHT